MKLSKKSIPFRTLSALSVVIIFLLFISVPAALVLFLPVLAILAGYQYLYWKNFEFYFEEGDLKVRSGVITKNELDIPIRRIQDIDIRKGVFQRIFGIAEVNIQTAGGDASKASLRYLEEEQAEQVKEQLRELKTRRAETETGDEESEAFYDIGDAILTYGFISGMRSTAGFLVLTLLIAVTATGINADNALEASGFLTAGIFSALILTGLYHAVTSASRVIRFYDFSVEKRDDVFEYEHGLLSKQGGSLPEEKIQKVEIAENFLMRRLGYASLRAESAGYQSIEDSGTTTKTLIPLDRREEVYRHAKRIGEVQEEVQDVGPTARKRYFRRYTAISTALGLGGLALIYLGLNPVILLVPVIGFLVARKAAELKWQNIGYALGENRLTVRRGFWYRKTYSVPYFRVQNLEVYQSPFQRRWGLATVTVDTAGDKMVNPRIFDVPREKAFELKEELFDRFKESVYS